MQELPAVSHKFKEQLLAMQVGNPTRRSIATVDFIDCFTIVRFSFNFFLIERVVACKYSELAAISCFSHLCEILCVSTISLYFFSGSAVCLF
jgi:hypothetical protein